MALQQGVTPAQYEAYHQIGICTYSCYMDIPIYLSDGISPEQVHAYRQIGLNNAYEISRCFAKGITPSHIKPFFTYKNKLNLGPYPSHTIIDYIENNISAETVLAYT